jgi:hypothetical protein
MKKSWKPIYVISLAILVLSCNYRTEEPRRMKKDDLVGTRQINVPTKIHLLDGGVILCPDGFFFHRDTIQAIGARSSLSRADATNGIWVIALDSVAAMEYFDKSVHGARSFGGFLLGVSATADIGMGAIFILKAIFGSCPTVYSFNGHQERLEAECFSYSIGRNFEMADLDRLNSQRAEDGRVVLRVKNEALETHYINEFTVCYADHPQGTEVFPTDDGGILAASHLVSPTSAVNSDGKDILETIHNRDSLVYKSDSASASRMFAEKRRDWIEFTVPLPPKSSSVVVALHVKNSLENTVLLYDVMMRNQGLNVLEWSQDVNESKWYAWRLAHWYKEFSGMELLVQQDGQYIRSGKIFDTGPIAWKLVAVQLPLKTHEDTLKIRLQFLPDNWVIDWVGFDFSGTPAPDLKKAACVDAKGNMNSSANNIIDAIREDDDNYFVTYPGEFADLSFQVPNQDSLKHSERTFFVHSKGYYVEWVRPEWVRIRPNVPGFDISQSDEMARLSSQLWLSKKNRFEDQFYRNRIPSWNSGGRP